ncbi:MAG: TetR/AcrR family transcriptional regulator [Candidatus Eisenbacteria bacterium]|nr:TetR/AcrR family transcriptional regulator [Candidatus Eisenbacteria bacterium]
MSRTPDATMRSRILDAADRLLVRSGFRRMTVEDIASEAGIGKGSVYLHFESKQDVALSCIDRMATRILGLLKSIAARPLPAAARLRAMLCARVLERFDYASRHAHSIDEKLAVMRQAMLERRAGHFERESAVLDRVVEEGRRSGEFTSAPRRPGRTLVTATNALLPYSLSARELGERAGLARRTEEVVGLLLAGLEPKSRPAKPRKRRIP